MSYPGALKVTARPGPAPGVPTVVFVHGSLDRGDSFRRVVRRLPDLATVTYDRRGYQGSRRGGIVGLAGHVSDLLDIAAARRTADDAPLVAVGHSFGGDVVMTAALVEPGAFDAIGAYEPPLPWFGFAPGDHRAAAAEPDPPAEAERFFRATTGVPAWRRLSERAKAERRADGPALVADMRSFDRPTFLFDVTELRVPAVVGMGGAGSAPHHRAGVRWLATHVRGATLFEIASAQHGAHLSHPDHFATMTRAVLAQAGAPSVFSHPPP